MSKLQISFYCAEREKNGYTCEAQCDKCKKAEQLDIPKPTPANIIHHMSMLREKFDTLNLEDSQKLIEEIGSWNNPCYSDQVYWMKKDLEAERDNQKAKDNDSGCMVFFT